MSGRLFSSDDRPGSPAVAKESDPSIVRVAH